MHGVDPEHRDQKYLRSHALPDEHLMLLGRLLELSAWLEFAGRTLISMALDVDPDRAEAMLLGSRMNTLQAQIVALAKLESAAPWLEEAAAWATRAKNAVDRRDALVHRQAASSPGPDGAPVPVLMASRRNQTSIDLAEAKVSDLVWEMVDLCRESSCVMLKAAAKPADDAPDL